MALCPFYDGTICDRYFRYGARGSLHREHYTSKQTYRKQLHHHILIGQKSITAKLTSFTSTTSPATGEYTSDAALTLSTLPKDSPAAYFAPTEGRSTKTTSPRAAAAKSVIPTVAISPSNLTYSWEEVYLVVDRALEEIRTVGSKADLEALKPLLIARRNIFAIAFVVELRSVDCNEVAKVEQSARTYYAGIY